MTTPDLPYDVVSRILSNTALKKDIPINRTTKVIIDEKVKSKLDKMCKRRTRLFAFQKNKYT